MCGTTHVYLKQCRYEDKQFAGVALRNSLGISRRNFLDQFEVGVGLERGTKVTQLVEDAAEWPHVRLLVVLDTGQLLLEMREQIFFGGAKYGCFSDRCCVQLAAALIYSENTHPIRKSCPAPSPISSKDIGLWLVDFAWPMPDLSVTQKHRCSCGIQLVALYNMPLHSMKSKYSRF